MLEAESHSRDGIITPVRVQGETLQEILRAVLVPDAQLVTVHLAAS